MLDGTRFNVEDVFREHAPADVAALSVVASALGDKVQRLSKWKGKDVAISVAQTKRAERGGNA